MKSEMLLKRLVRLSWKQILRLIVKNLLLKKCLQWMVPWPMSLRSHLKKVSSLKPMRLRLRLLCSLIQL
eukprot:4730055-Amphidinium_carterae.1